MESVQGYFISCGIGVVSFGFTCTGSDCDVLATFPNVTCHASSDGASTICSNGIKCSSPSTYSSNYTLGQTGGLVSVEKTVDLGDCGAYSSGTNGSIYDGSTSETRERNGACKLSRDNSSSTQTTSTTSTTPSASGTQTTTAAQKSTGTTRTRPSQKATFFAIYSLFMMVFLANPTWALEHTDAGSGILTSSASSSNSNHFPVMAKKSTPPVERDNTNDQNPWLTEAQYIAEWWTTKANTQQGADLKEDYKQTIIAGAKSIACHSFYDPLPDKLLHFDVFDGMCMTFVMGLSIFTAATIPGGQVGLWVARLAGTQLCHLVISQTIGQLEASKITKNLIDAICDNIAPAPDPLTVCMFCKTNPKMLKRDSGSDNTVAGNLLKDPNNCGFCGNQCASGICQDGSCVSNSCTGQTCDTFTECGPGGDCVCASTSGGTGFCVDSSTTCADLTPCATKGDCNAGEVCAVQTCCDTPVCIGATYCGASSSSPSLLFARSVVNGSTIAHRGRPS